MEQLVTSYQTIENSAVGIFKDKGSKFLSFAYPVKSETEIKQILENIKKEYFDARHHCYAYRLGADLKTYRSNDDGEPSGTAGRPILGQIQSNNLTNILIVVVRYFGGTLLGTSGLIQAYKLSSADAIANSSVIELPVCDIYQVNFNYSEMNIVMKIVKEYNLETIKTDLNIQCSLTLRIKKEVINTVLSKFDQIKPLELIFLNND